LAVSVTAAAAAAARIDNAARTASDAAPDRLTQFPFSGTP
jgi:hypothetical protein